MNPVPHVPRARLALLLLVLLPACRRQVATLTHPSRAAVALSGGPGTSMAYLARTSEGVIVIDLGWWGGARAVRRALRQLDAEAGAVRDVFLTHSHRDHVGAWRLLRGSRFHVAAAERPRLTGAAAHRAWIPRMADRLRPPALPRDGQVAVHTFSRDTLFAFGADTLRAYVVPGHTAGSAVYLFRGILFLGDAATYSRWTGFAPARGIYSDDRDQAVRSLDALWARLPAGAVRHVCTAHAHCAPFTPALLDDIRR